MLAPSGTLHSTRVSLNEPALISQSTKPFINSGAGPSLILTSSSETNELPPKLVPMSLM